MEVHIRQFEEYLEIFINGAKFWSGNQLNGKVLNTLLTITGVKTSLENVRGSQYEQELS